MFEEKCISNLFGRRGIPVCHTDIDSNLFQILQVMAKDDLNIKSWMIGGDDGVWSNRCNP